MQTQYPPASGVQRTTNYKAFKILKYNRGIKQSNVEKLVKLNEEKFNFHNFPIVVSEEMEVIDGQHRLAACKLTKCPVYYIVDEACAKTIKDINRVNTAGTKHTFADLVNMYLAAKDPEVTKAYDFYNKFNGEFPLVSTVKLLASFSAGGSLKTTMLNNNYQIKNWGELETLYNGLKISKFDNYNGDSFLLAFALTIKKNSLQIKPFISRIHKNRAMLSGRGSKAAIGRSLIETYNHGLLLKNRIS